MTKKTIELIESKGYKLYTVEFNDITKKDTYIFNPDILKNNHYKVIIKHKRKNNEYLLYKIITDGQNNEYKSYIIEDIRNTNTFKKLIRELL